MATETVDISGDYLAWDNVETVYCTYSIDGKIQPRKPIEYALRVDPKDRRSSYFDVRTSSRETTFWLPVAELGSEEPDGNMLVERQSDGKRYRLMDSKLIVLGSSESHWDVLVSREQDEK